jgi:hypothetical protein
MGTSKALSACGNERAIHEGSPAPDVSAFKFASVSSTVSTIIPYASSFPTPISAKSASEDPSHEIIPEIRTALVILATESQIIGWTSDLK